MHRGQFLKKVAKYAKIFFISMVQSQVLKKSSASCLLSLREGLPNSSGMSPLPPLGCWVWSQSGCGQLGGVSTHQLPPTWWRLSITSMILVHVCSDLLLSPAFMHSCIFTRALICFYYRLLRKTDSSVSEVDRASQYLIFMLSVLLGSEHLFLILHFRCIDH